MRQDLPEEIKNIKTSPMDVPIYKNEDKRKYNPML